MTYAAHTQVSVEKSKVEIERTLTRYGASGFMSGWQNGRAVIGFVLGTPPHLRQIRFVLELPDRNDKRFTMSKRPSWRPDPNSPEKALALWEQACRSRWRALALCIKAKLEACEAGITDIENEFLAHTVLPNGQTAGQWMLPQIAAACETGRMPLALGSGS